jgi:hypothetical protein
VVGYNISLGKEMIAFKILFPSDIMSSKTRRNYQKIVSLGEYNMYEKVVKIEDFMQLTVEQQLSAFKVWKKRYTTKQIAEGLGVKEWKVYGIGSKLGISKTIKPVKNTEIVIQKTVPEKTQSTTEEVITKRDLIGLLQEFSNLHTQNIKTEAVQDNLSFQYSGIFDSQTIVDRVQKLLILLEGEKGTFQIEISVTEIQKDNT